LICVNCAHIDERQAKALEKEIRDTLKHVARAVKDYAAMCEKALNIRQTLLANSDSLTNTELNLEESCEFIFWLVDNHFTFLGYEQYKIIRTGKEPVIELVPQSTLGISRFKTGIEARMKFS
jgi:glutamate dehydrogenase